MELYNGKINEFIDWVSGRNSFTGQSITEGLPVSGGSIRELLQNKLKNPFYMYEDKASNKYRMFSSEDAFAMWKENPTDNQDLELFNFVRPSDYKLELTAKDSDGFNNKYIRYGDTDSASAKIAYHWSIYNDEGESSDSLSATYTITNSSTGASTTFTRWYNRSDADPNFSIYNYLAAGENVVTIEAKGTTTGARNTKTFTVVLLQINLTSTFKFYEKFASNAPIQIPYIFERNNTSGSAKIHFRIDGGGEGKEYIKDVLQDGPSRVVDTQMMQTVLSSGEHSLQIWAEAKYNDGQTSINSNLLYFTFTVASSVIGSTDKFINIHKSFTSGDFPLNDLMITATQYEQVQLQWGYYTDSLQTNTSISVNWKLLDNDEVVASLGTITANSQEKAENLQFVPTIYTQEDHETYVAAYFGNTLIKKFPIYIVKNNKVKVNETGFYELKMSAYGRTNDSVTKDQWLDESGNVSTTFTGVQWNTNSGWYNNSFRTVGQSENAVINFHPFSTFDFTSGKTIEIEFESEKVSNEDDVLITIGNPQGARIEITPDTATLYNNANTEVVHTNYKSNERVKLAFIINAIQADTSARTVESGLAYIVNNGVLERAASAAGSSFDTEGSIKIGGTKSGVRVYTLRIYPYSIRYVDAYNNFVYDSENKAEIADRNNILDSTDEISFDLCKNRLDTILISGNLTNILNGQSDKDESTTDVTIERFCPSDSTKNFTLTGAQIRKHGQSTLHYPITSMKFWTNKSKAGAVPAFETQQADLLLNKNRYVMKSVTDGGKPSIPANKFVLQANYADSSGVHNGGLQRLIQQTWFNAKIDGEYKLRTEPQLFATSELVHHNNQNLHEDGSVEGYSNVDGKENIQWKDVSNSAFPYDIRISPDSFPCAVFYYDEEGSQKRTFLGQYVFMDDKKSDYTYGERSIYAVPSDPFCLTNTHKSEDTSTNRVWSNKDVLRIEVVGSNVPFTSYMTHAGFTDIVTVQDVDENNEPTGKSHRAYNWEQDFEIVYPDEDDIAEDDAAAGIDKFNPNSKYVNKVQPFIDFHAWVVSTYQNQEKFQNEAAQHLDLYKMAAYYIFAMRFGLVDSLERNAQLKTYDGQHWHYEPWDMDIALGNKNDGGIAYEPPIDRNTKLPGSISTYAFSGRSANNSGTVVTSNWLWDALEAWPYWRDTVVSDVASALYTAGLTYENVSKMFDKNYADAWNETMYNESGFFKYVESGNGDPTWLSWLQGSRLTHRHWWLSSSMDYYDAKWQCGDYKNHIMYLRANVTEGSDENVIIVPNKATFMSVTKDGVPQATRPVSKENPFVFSMSGGSNTKNPIDFYGTNFAEEVNLSQIAHGFDGIELNGVYSEVLGSPLKKLNVGTILTETDGGYTTTLASLGCNIQGNARVFENLQSLNVQGQLNFTDLNSLIYGNNATEIQEVLAMGSGVTGFFSSQSGNNFTKIQLPDTIYTFYMNNSMWSNLSFWHCEADENNFATLTEAVGIPTSIHEVSLLGTTGSTIEGIQFVKQWLNSLVAANVDLSQYTLTMDKINWSDNTVGATNLLTYEDLSHLAQLRNADKLKGYLVLKDTGEELSAEQLNMIKSWFGDTVFTKNSSGLVVDHKRQYIQINIGGDVIVDQLGNVTLVEGHTASLNATRFSLSEDNSTEYQWSIGPANSNDSTGSYGGLTVIQSSESNDGFAYIQSTQSQMGHDYDVKIYTSVAGVNYSTTIHVIAASYPTEMYISYTQESTASLREAPGFIEFPMTNTAASFFVDSNDTYTATIRNITYTLTRQSDNAIVSYVTGGDATALSLFTDPYLTTSKSTLVDGMKIHMNTFMPDEVQLYTLTANVLFTSGKQMTCSSTIVVQSDCIIVPASSQAIYGALNDAWTSQFGSALGKNNFYKVDLMAIQTGVDFSSYASSLSSLTTYDNQYLLKYIPNVPALTFDGCTQLTSTNFVFDKMPNLVYLSIEGCTGLTGTIDLSNNSIQQLYASGTTVSFTLPSNTTITNYELGTPSSISINNPVSLTPANIAVDSTTNLASLSLINVNSSTLCGYNTLAKIFGV